MTKGLVIILPARALNWNAGDHMAYYYLSYGDLYITTYYHYFQGLRDDMSLNSMKLESGPWHTSLPFLFRPIHYYILHLTVSFLPSYQLAHDQGLGDDTGLSSIKLECRSPWDNAVTGYITSTTGPFGGWESPISCPTNYWMTSFIVRKCIFIYCHLFTLLLHVCLLVPSMQCSCQPKFQICDNKFLTYVLKHTRGFLLRM